MFARSALLALLTLADPSYPASIEVCRPNLSDVDDFLSDIERENLARRAAAEDGVSARQVGSRTEGDADRQLQTLATRVSSGQASGAWEQLHAAFPEPERLRGCADESVGVVVTRLLALHWDLLDDLARIVGKQPAWLDAALYHLGGVEGFYLREVEENTRRCPSNHAEMCRRILEVAQAHRKAVEGERRREQQ